MNEFDETDGQPRAYEYEPGDEGEPSIGGRLILTALGWGAAGWCLIGGCWLVASAIVGMLS